MFDEHVNRMWLESIMPPALGNSADLAAEEVGERLFGEFSTAGTGSGNHFYVDISADNGRPASMKTFTAPFFHI